MHFYKLGFIFICIIFLGACTSATPGPTPAPQLPSLAGAWQSTSDANIFRDVGLGNLQFLRFTESSDSSGSLEVFGIRPETNVLACGQLVFATVAEDTLSLYSDVFSSRLLQFETTDTSLTLKDESGLTQTFTKVTEVSSSAICEKASFEASFETIPVNLTSFTGLVSDGTNLRVASEDGNVYPINPSNGQLGVGTVLVGGNFGIGGSPRHIVAMQGTTDYWGHCGCGGSQEIVRYKAGAATAVDIIDTATDLPKEIGVREAVYDGTHLWIAGYSYDEGKYLILKVDSDAEPDVLLSDFAFDDGLIGFTILGGQLWGLVNVLGYKLIQIDPALGKATRTIDIPALEQGNFRGLEAFGGSLYLLAEVTQNTAALYKVTP
ncbi:MAG: hypothetical protein KC422_22205 [Trueperaceae bacterium]|nr:hypothetical protein [Trueperaceae bacterium]